MHVFHNKQIQLCHYITHAHVCNENVHVSQIEKLFKKNLKRNKATTKKILKTCHINHHTQTHYTFFVIMYAHAVYREVLQINGAISLNTRF